MQSIYTSYECNWCKRELVLTLRTTEELSRSKEYLLCAYCSSKRFRKEKRTDNLKGCMSERWYKRVSGAINQK